MSIKLSKNNLCINQIIGQKTEKIVIEGDEIVPDVKPDILNVVSANGNVCIYKKDVQDGKVKLDGSVNVYVIYIADDERAQMRALNACIDFSKTIDMKEVKAGMQVECRAELLNVECKILNGRKINLKANTQVTLTAYSRGNIDYINKIDNADSLQLLNESISINSLLGSGTTKVYAKDTVAIESTDNLSEVMNVTMTITNRENKISYNKVLTKADAVFKVTYLTDDNRVNTANATIPIMGFIDMQDVSEDNVCDVSYELRNILIKPNNVEEHSMHIEAELEILCFVYKKQEINMIQDLYSKTKELQYTQKNVKIIKNKEEISEMFNFRKQEKIEEIGQNKLFDVSARTTIISTQIEEGKIIYQGEINLTFMYQETTSSRIGVKSLVEPFEYTVTSQTITTKTKIDTNIEIAKQDFIVTADSNVEVKIDLNFRLNLSNERELRLIDNIEEAKESNRETFSIVIYYTKEGDTLWNIAKKFGSTVDEIVKVNNIENPDVIMPGEQLFIPR